MTQNLVGDSPRRTWLQRTLAGAVSLTLVAVFYPVARFLRPRVATASGALDVVAPFRLNQLPGAPGNPFEVGGKPCLVVLTAEGARRKASGQQLRAEDLRAFNAICTHVDCTVRYRLEEGDIFCSCHDGVYDLNGQNVSGPPPRPLEAYRITLRGDPGLEEIVVSRQT